MHAVTFTKCIPAINLLLIANTFFALCSYGQHFNSAQLKEQEKLVDEFQRIKYAKIDSLKRKIESCDDTTKVNCLIQLYGAELQLNSNAAIGYLSQAGRLSQKVGYKKGYAMFLEHMGDYYMETKNLPLSEKYLRQATDLYKQLRFDEEYFTALRQLGHLMYWRMQFVEAARLHKLVYDYRKNFPRDPKIALTYRNLGIILDAQGNYEEAFAYYRKGMDISKEIKDSKGSRKSYGIFANFYLGNMYMQAGDKRNAVKYFRAAAERALNNVMPDVYDRQLGQINFLLENYDSARYYFLLEQYCMSRQLKDSAIKDMALRYSNISVAQTYVLQDKFDTAITLLEHSLKIYKGSIFANDIYYYLARAYFGSGQYARSLEYSRELMHIAGESGARPYKRDAAEMHYKVFDRLGNTDSAYKYLRIFLSISDSLSADKQLRNIAVAEWQAVDENNKSAILLLNKEKIINNKQKQVLLISLFAFVLAGFVGIRHFILRHKHDRIKQTQLEMQALRSQMNPHFIFNSLNSINNFILRHDTVAASRYLTKFSRLIRMMLQHSQRPQIPLQDELDALRIYIELEQLRFDNRFEYSIHVPDDLDATSFNVPPLIIQPFVENAIWHGLMHKQGRGHLSIRLYVANDAVYCDVEDDGVGRKQSVMSRNGSGSTYVSMGIKITTLRISRLDKTNRAIEPVTIKDNVHPDGTAAGTTVIIKLPGNYD